MLLQGFRASFLGGLKIAAITVTGLQASSAAVLLWEKGHMGDCYSDHFCVMALLNVKKLKLVN